VSFSQAQETKTKDSTQTSIKEIIKSKKYYSMRFGVDLSRPIIQLIQKETIGIEITGDFRLAKNWYIATEFGFESEPTTEEYLQFHTKGSYTKLGFNYNLYENLKGINNEIYFGIRYGFSQYQQELISFTALDLTNYFQNHHLTANEVHEGLSAHWGEIHFGLKVETLPNLFLTAGVHFKKLFSGEENLTFNQLYIPGIGDVLLNKNAVGFNYTLSYNIPLAKK
jgi:hypothetical protein